MVVVVLGMHRSGTSLVANVLHHLGVHMGDRLLGPNEWNPYGHWEDLDFFELNAELLKAAGGDWAHPPAAGVIEEVGRWFMPEMRHLVRWKASQGRQVWGWKDPRTALTAWVWQRALEEAGVGDDVRYVHVVRERDAVVGSLERRARGAWEKVRRWVEEGRVSTDELGEAAKDEEMAGWGAEEWGKLVWEYETRIGVLKYSIPRQIVRFERFVDPVVIVRFERFVDPVVVEEEVRSLAQFVGLGMEAVARAVGQVMTRE